MRAKNLAFMILAVGIIAVSLPTLSAGQSDVREQTLFGAEGKVEKKHGTYIDHPPVERPVALPEEILKLLRAEDRVAKCLRSEGLNEAPASWFVASQVHLHDKDQADYVVLPVDGCLFGQTTIPFWLFGKTARGYDMILKTDQLGIEVLKSKTNGYLDIKGMSSTAAESYIVKFKFDGQRYQMGSQQVR